MNDAFIVTIHALERFEERFPKISKSLTDRELGEFIHSEVMEALDAGRQAKMPPIELAPYKTEYWIRKEPGSSYVWNEDKMRGYAIVEDPKEGTLVATVLVGEERSYAMRKLRNLQP